MRSVLWRICISLAKNFLFTFFDQERERKRENRKEKGVGIILKKSNIKFIINLFFKGD